MPQKILSGLDVSAVILIGFGFLLGLFGNMFLQRINREKSRGVFLDSLYDQFRETLPKIKALNYIIHRSFRKIDCWTLTYILSSISETGDYSKAKKEEIDKLLDEESPELTAMMAAIKILPRSQMFVPTLNLPFLESNISSILLLDSDLQQNVLTILTKANCLNEEIDRNNSFIGETVDSLSKENYDIVRLNIDKNYEVIEKLCRETAGLISKFLREVERG